MTAVRTGGALSTTVIRQAPRKFRTLTAREAATAQGYQVTYQFWANSMSGKDALIRNALPPPMARAAATAIRAAEGLTPLGKTIIEGNPELPGRWL
jgi:site-specific DNA-cytosine methylase